MAKLLFPLRGVPDDEAEAVRLLLGENEIATSETHAGVLGIGTAAIWVTQADDFDKAKRLLSDFQQQRYQNARAEYALDKQAGRERTTLDLFKEKPLQYIGYVVVAIMLIYLVMIPFFIL